MLLVDNNFLILVSLEGILIASGSGWQAVTAMDGLQALVELEVQTFDLIVTDCQMPDMDGLEFLEAVRHRLPDIPVILLIGHDRCELQEEALQLGVVCVLKKPVPGPVFLKAVREVLDPAAQPPVRVAKQLPEFPHREFQAFVTDKRTDSGRAKAAPTNIEVFRSRSGSARGENEPAS
jgi:CheY-like chemotaxis protein